MAENGVTRWFLDTEFHDDGRTVDLISIALVCEDESSGFYAVSSEFDEPRCNSWLKANVIPKLPPRHTWQTRQQIADGVLSILRSRPNPQIWAYFAAYDWVAFCQLFGPMMELPQGLPMHCMDIRQVMVERGIARNRLPDNDCEHDALADAMWNRDAFAFIQGISP